MTATSIIQELEHLTVNDRLFVIERTLRTIRIEKEKRIIQAVDSLYDDYNTNKELTVFTELDNEPFYETR